MTCKLSTVPSSAQLHLPWLVPDMAVTSASEGTRTLPQASTSVSQPYSDSAHAHTRQAPSSSSSRPVALSWARGPPAEPVRVVRVSYQLKVS